jgi:hypothetical protein
MPPTGFEPRVPASKRPQTHALDRTVIGIGNSTSLVANNLAAVHCTVGATDSFVKNTTNTQIIFGKEVDGNSDALSEDVEQNFNQEYQLHCSVEHVASIFRVEDGGIKVENGGNTNLQKLDTSYHSTRRQFPVDVTVAIT